MTKQQLFEKYVRKLGQNITAGEVVYDIKQLEDRGRWIPHYDGEYECSACGEWWGCGEDTPEEIGLLYCPHCGAKMEVEDAD